MNEQPTEPSEKDIEDLEVTESAEQVRGGETVHIPAAQVPKFSAGSQLKQAVRQ